MAQKLTVVYGDARALIRCKYVTTVTATLKAAHCVHTLVVTQTAAWGLTLINVCIFLCDRDRKGKKVVKIKLVLNLK